MTQYVFANNVQTTLAAAATSSDTTLTLGSSNNLPSLTTGQVMPLWLNDAATRSVYELVYVTGISGATLTVERGQEGTTAVAWSTGDLAYCGPTEGTVANVYGNSSYPFEVADSTSGTQQAVPRSQADSTYLTQTNAAADYAAINGNSSETFSAAAASADGEVGIWQQLTASGSYTDQTTNRSTGVTYTNSASHVMFVYLTLESTTSGNSYADFSVGTASFSLSQNAPSANAQQSWFIPVPPGSTYELGSITNGTIFKWAEFV